MPRVFLPEKSSIERGGVSFDAGGKMLALSLSGSAVTKRRIDTQAVRDAVQGRPAAELQGVLASEGGIESFTVKFFPFWLRQVPASQKKIELQEAES
jgi:hypothetical protein